MIGFVRELMPDAEGGDDGRLALKLSGVGYGNEVIRKRGNGRLPASYFPALPRGVSPCMLFCRSSRFLPDGIMHSPKSPRRIRELLDILS